MTEQKHLAPEGWVGQDLQCWNAWRAKYGVSLRSLHPLHQQLLRMQLVRDIRALSERQAAASLKAQQPPQQGFVP